MASPRGFSRNGKPWMIARLGMAPTGDGAFDARSHRACHFAPSQPRPADFVPAPRSYHNNIMSLELLTLNDNGLYCPPGDFYVDPWRPVPRAVITHAHGDHARPGNARYLATDASRTVLEARLPGIGLDTLGYGERVVQGGVAISLHPAGHVLGS